MSAHEPIAYPGGNPSNNPDDIHLLLNSEIEEPFFRTLIRNVKEFVHPPKLPPLVLTSKPVAVKEIWGFYGGQGRRAGMTSFLVHVCVIGLLFLLGTNKAVQQVKKDAMHGGGGGGDRSPTPVSKGNLPKLAKRQFVPPMITHVENPKLVMDPTLIMPPDTNTPKITSPDLADPLSKSGLASNGFGSGGGMGSGRGGGVGPGLGPGVGPGSGAGMGGGAYKIGGRVSPPSILFKVEPEYSEEA